MYAALAGNASESGRTSVARGYIEGLLNTKIITIVQRDGWEDHYRLFEGLLSGAMVMCDRMLGMPSGLVNGTHLIEFTGEHDFIEKALYYLEHDDERQAIAYRGRELAMTRHRSWHHMEQIILGQPITMCPRGVGVCPACQRVRNGSLRPPLKNFLLHFNELLLWICSPSCGKRYRVISEACSSEQTNGHDTSRPVI